MDGEELMEFSLGFVIEIVNNLFQSSYLVGFLYIFFEKKSNKLFNIISYCTATLLYFFLNNYYTYHELTFNHSDAVFGIAILMMYSLICLKGKVILRIIMPIVDMLISAVCGFGSFYLFSLFGKRPFVEALTFSNAYRYLFMIVSHTTTLFVYWLVLKFSKKRIRINSAYEIMAFIVVPVVSLIGVYSAIIAYEHTDFDPDILMYMSIVMIVLIVNAVVFWIIVDKISKDNKTKTELLLSNQREEMYKESVISTGEQISKMTEIKHDMKNNLKSIRRLIENGQYDEAKRLCVDSSESIAKVYTPINTDNPTLNAILNVEIEKARQSDISFSYTVTDSLDFVSSTDVVSIIGNLCDNAIEYLSTIDKGQRKMSLEITVRNDYRIIVCRNTILSSVLSVNPDMKTTKNNDTLHGKGLNILRNIAEAYNGTLSYKEDDGNIEVTLIIKEMK